MSDYRILPMEQAHIDGVSLLHAECFAGERWSRAMIAQELDKRQSPFAVTLVAVNGERVIGFINARCIAGECGVNDIAVTASARKAGVGTALLDALEKYARAQGAAVIQLEVRASNETAIRFYERRGFIRNGLRKRYYSAPVEDALLYEKGIGG